MKQAVMFKGMACNLLIEWGRDSVYIKKKTQHQTLDHLIEDCHNHKN